ncbi:MAG: DUF3084 domain-containing protein [Synechococcaceae bacterium WBB_3_034]|nr:DUF3084 domain-containing protein [Synechococcaceae bacterium WBB_3_034]NDG22962.1 DUF3084 domain-containing protein [Synechococcaceae bacterium WBB_10_009]
MSGWLLILALLLLGGVLSTLGDRLGSKVGKARLSLMGMRPRRTAVLITVLTGSLISGISLGLMLLVSDRLRTGLFELDQIERRLRDSREALSRSQALLQSSRTAVRTAEQGRQQARTQLTRVEGQARRLRGELAPLMQQRQLLEQERDRLNRDINAKDTDIRRNREELARLNSRIAAGSKELQTLETNLIALRRGDVVITAGQPLEIAKVRIDNGDQAQAVIEALLRQANSNVYQLVLPGQAPNRQILLVPKSDINRLEQVLRRRGEWVVSVISVANVLKGERQVVAFPDVRPNKRVVKAGEVLASSALEADETSAEQVRSRLNLLLAAAFNKVKQQGSLTSGLQFDPAALNQLGIQLSSRPPGPAVQLEVIALQSRDLAEPVAVEIRIRR